MGKSGFEELRNMYSTDNNFRVIKSRMVRQEGCVAHIRKNKKCKQNFDWKATRKETTWII